MLTVALRGLRANVGRYVATLVAIITGVGFLAAGLIVTDTASSALKGEAGKRYASVDAVVRPTTESAIAGDRVPAETLEQVRATPGVAAAAGELEGQVSVLGADGRPVRSDTTGRLWVVDDALNPLDIQQGRPPTAADEVALDRDLAEERSVSVGDRITIATAVGARDVTVVGLTSAGSTNRLDPGGTVSVPDSSAFEVLNGGVTQYSQILVRGDGGPQDELQRALEPVAPPGAEVVTGRAFVREQQGEAASIASAVRPALVFFSLLALFVCGFVIFNTFSVVIAQRLRELALLRAIGATPKQVRRSVRVEGLAIGVVGSVGGVAVGAGLAVALRVALERFGITLPGDGVQVTTTTIVVGVFAGTLITVLSVAVPARRAARIAPIEALRSTATEGGGVSGVRRVVSLGLLGIGVAALLLAVATGKGIVVGIGVVVFFLGVVIAGPVFAGALAALVRRPLAASGMTGQLASDNTARNPKRTAITANALVIGLFLITFVSVAGTTVRARAVEAVNQLSTVDLVVQADAGEVPAEVVEQIRAVPGVATVAPVATDALEDPDGRPVLISTGDPGELDEVGAVKVTAGSLADLGTDGIALTATPGAASTTGQPALGDEVRYLGADGAEVRLKVKALLEFNISSIGLQQLMSPAAFEQLFGEPRPTSALIRTEKGANDEARADVDRVIAPYGNLSLRDGNAFGRTLDQLLGFAINAVNGLLLMSVAIALIGIVNTLTLSVNERRHEIGLLRAVGMTPRQVRSMIRLEALLLALLGTLTGMIAGAVVGWALVATLAGGSVAVPWATLGLVLVMGVVVGVLASLLPSRRASRVDVLDALRAA